MKNSYDLAARTAWGEARGEGSRGMEAVIHVINNRVNNPSWWGDDVAEVVFKDAQFSALSVGDPNRDKALAVKAGDPQFDAALELAEGVLSGAFTDITFGATHYHTLDVNPRWAAKLIPTVQIGHHQFYRRA